MLGIIVSIEKIVDKGPVDSIESTIPVDISIMSMQILINPNAREKYQNSLLDDLPLKLKQLANPDLVASTKLIYILK
jgi:hypothetical protein